LLAAADNFLACLLENWSFFFLQHTKGKQVSRNEDEEVSGNEDGEVSRNEDEEYKDDGGTRMKTMMVDTKMKIRYPIFFAAAAFPELVILPSCL
jgi:hypothetical protein